MDKPNFDKRYIISSYKGIELYTDDYRKIERWMENNQESVFEVFDTKEERFMNNLTCFKWRNIYETKYHPIK